MFSPHTIKYSIYSSSSGSKSTAESTELYIDRNGNTTLHNAIYGSQLILLKNLLKQSTYKQMINQPNWNGLTPLHVAVCIGNLTIVSLLLEADAKTEITNTFGQTILHTAATKGHLDIVECLWRQKVNFYAVDHHKNTAIHLAAFQGHVELLKFLIVHSNLLYIGNEIGDTALHIAVFKGHIESVKLLIQYMKKLDTKNIKGNTALHLAVAQGNTQIVALFLIPGDHLNTMNDADQTPIESVLVTDKSNIFKMLLDYGSNIHTQNNILNDALEMAAENGSLEIIKLLHQDPSWNFKADNTLALHLAAYYGQVKAFELLIYYGYPSEVLDRDSNSPLHAAVMGGHFKNDQMTPYSSAMGNRMEIIDMLLQMKVNTHKKNVSGDTPMDIAIKHGYTHVIEMLGSDQLYEESSSETDSETNIDSELSEILDRYINLNYNSIASRSVPTTLYKNAGSKSTEHWLKC